VPAFVALSRARYRAPGALPLDPARAFPPGPPMRVGDQIFVALARNADQGQSCPWNPPADEERGLAADECGPWPLTKERILRT